MSSDRGHISRRYSSLSEVIKTSHRSVSLSRFPLGQIGLQDFNNFGSFLMFSYTDHLL